MELFICVLGLLPGYIIGGVLLSGRGASLISGFNTLPRQEQQKWNQVAMCRFVGILLLAFMLLLTISIGSLFLWGSFVLFVIGMVVASAEILFGLLYLNKSSRFKNE